MEEIKNIFEETVNELKKEVKFLTEKLRNATETKVKLDATRLLKDTLALIKEYSNDKDENTFIISSKGDGSIMANTIGLNGISFCSGKLDKDIQKENIDLTYDDIKRLKEIIKDIDNLKYIGYTYK